LHLELLECRTVPSTVTTLLDNVSGSLRDAIVTTPPGGTVDFQPGLSGTIVLSGSPLSINKDLTVTGPGASAMPISGGHVIQVFLVGAGASLTLLGRTVADGHTQSWGGGIVNNGALSITGCAISDNSSAGQNNSKYLNGSSGGILNYGDSHDDNHAESGRAARCAGLAGPTAAGGYGSRAGLAALAGGAEDPHAPAKEPGG
jgi:hypothetical protein